MEKKKKRVFVLGLVALLSVISIGMILLCRNIQSENQGTQTVDVSAVSREMLLFMLDQTRVVNKDYSVLSLGEDVPYSIRSELEYVMEEDSKGRFYQLAQFCISYYQYGYRRKNRGRRYVTFCKRPSDVQYIYL